MSVEPLVAHAGNTYIEVNETDLKITTKHGLVHKSENIKVIPIRHIAKVELKQPGLLVGHLKIWYSYEKLKISSYETLLGSNLEAIFINKKEILGFPEIHTYISESIIRYPSSSAKYVGGHPSIPDNNVDCLIAVQDDGILVEKFPEYTEFFKVPWEKIDSITTDIKSDWQGANLAAGWLLLGPIGSMLIGKSTKEQLGIVVNGKDGKGNPVKVPIAFDSVKNITKIKDASDRYMMQTAGISI